MVEIFETKQIAKQIRSAPIAIKKSYQTWLKLVGEHGYAYLRNYKGYMDESLLGNWHGYRSSRLNKSWRVIYKVSSSDIEVITVIRISNHDYKKSK